MSNSPWHNYNVGPVKPWVQFAANQIGTMFKVSTIYGFGQRDGVSDHPLGLALDFMVYGDSGKGDAIAAYCQQNYKQLNIYYIIWEQHIWDWKRDPENAQFPNGWRVMPDRGSPTANHMDHVHVSFESSADAGHTYPNYKNHDPAPDTPWNKALGAAGNIKDALAWLGNGHNWFRLFLVFAGAILIGFGLLKFDNVSAAVGNVAAIGKAVK